MSIKFFFVGERRMFGLELSPSGPGNEKGAPDRGYVLRRRSGAKSLTLPSQQQIDCSALSEGEEGYCPDSWPFQPSERNRPHSLSVSG